MTCIICGDREAIVFMRRSGQGPGGELALCEDCARERGLSIGRGRIELRLEDLIADKATTGGAPSLHCPSCGRDIDLVRREASLGCALCADVFRAEVERYMRARARPPFWRPEPQTAPDPRPAAVLPSPPRVQPSGSAALRHDLESALAAEDYEKAAALRDRIAKLGLPKATPDPAPPPPGPSPLSPELAAILAAPVFHADFSPRPDPGPEDDVVLRTRLGLTRNFAGRPFPGQGGQSDAPALVAASAHPLDSRRLGELPSGLKTALMEASFFSRGYGLDPDKLLAWSREEPFSLSFDEGNHISLTVRMAGLASRQALDLAAGVLPSLFPGAVFAFDEEFGYLSSRLMDCGSGISLRALLHLPALGQEGLIDKALRGLLSRGLAVRGFYGADEGSVGDLYEIGSDHCFGQTASSLVADFDAALASMVKAERRAREEALRKKREELADRAGRALGLFRFCGFLSVTEAAAGLSALRFASLLGLATGLDSRLLGRLLFALGSGMLGLGGSADAGEPRGRRAEERLRARTLAGLTAVAEIVKGGS
jgi:protein arginine kinase